MVLSLAEDDTISISPSPSISAAKTEFAPSASVATSLAVQVGFASPLFSYQAIVSSLLEADTISISPSPSISAEKTPYARAALVSISAAVKLNFFLAPVLICQRSSPEGLIVESHIFPSLSPPLV